jgi:hypothetical protein
LPRIERREEVDEMTDEVTPGNKLVNTAIEMVIGELRRHPDGLRNVEVGELTGLFLPVANHPGYITWTILRYLVEQNRVEKRGRLYRLQPGTRDVG